MKNINICRKISFFNNKTRGFSLAEVMITVVIIGVVAIFTLPVLISDLSERVNSNRQANIAQKITKAVEIMTVNGDYDNFNTTDEFVNKLQKYLKIVKRCNSNNLTECWPVQTVTTIDGKINVSNVKTGKELHTANTSDNVGLVLADGSTLIITYNPNIRAISAEGGFLASTKELPIGFGKTKEFAYTSNATEAIDFVMDVNGATGPNAEKDENGKYYDIRSFQTASFGAGTCNGGIQYSDYCFVDIGKNYSPISCAGGANSNYCGKGSGYSVDYWAGINKACDQKGMRQATVEEIRTLINSGKVTLNSSYSTKSEKYSFAMLKIDPNGVSGEAQKSSNFPGMCISVKSN